MSRLPGYAAARNRLGLLLETHMLKPYAVRVEATRKALVRIAEMVAREREALAAVLRRADESTAGAEFRRFRHNDMAHLEGLLKNAPPDVAKLVIAASRDQSRPDNVSRFHTFLVENERDIRGSNEAINDLKDEIEIPE